MSRERRIALKGETAINLVEQGLPRLIANVDRG